MSNPMARNSVYEQVGVSEYPMTISGAINKTAFLLLIVAMAAAYTWYLAMTGFADKVGIFMIGGFIGGIIAGFMAIFMPKHSMPLSITYALCEGLLLGGFSAMYEKAFHGIVPQAILGTFVVLFVMLGLYKSGAIRATEKFRKVLLVATVSVAVFYLINIIAAFAAPHFVAAGQFVTIFRTGPIGIGISLIIIAIASLNFIIDFDFVERGAASLAPKYFEWYGGFMLLVTLIWLYLEILRLLSMLRDR